MSILNIDFARLFIMKVGILHRLLLIVAFITSVVVVEAKTYTVKSVPNVQKSDARQFVTNPDGILSSGTVAELNELCYTLREQGIAEVVIVAVDDIAPRDMFSFSQELATSWGVGDSELDNGLLILFVGDMREIRFHTGYGLEGVLPDAMCVRIQEDYMVPWFKEENYNQGMIDGMQAVDKLLIEGELPRATKKEQEDTRAMVIALFSVLSLLGGYLAWEITTTRKLKKCPNCGKHKLRVTERVVVEETASYVTIQETLVCQSCHTTHTRTTRRDKGGGGGGLFVLSAILGGMGRGGGGGSFGGGFGGGSFGGGGGVSRW